MREFGSFAVFALVSFDFIPFILAQNEDLRPASALVLGFGAGGFRCPPCALLYDARPLALRPPFGFLPSFLVHASVIVISFWQSLLIYGKRRRLAHLCYLLYASSRLIPWQCAPALRGCLRIVLLVSYWLRRKC